MTQAALDPKREVKKFKTDQTSLVDKPGNGKEFLLIQDAYTEEMTEAVSILWNLLGPAVNFMAMKAQESLFVLEKHLREKMGSSMPMMYSASEENDRSFPFTYPEPAVIADAIVKLSAVPDDSEVSEAVAEVLAVVRAYTIDAWALSDTAVFVPGSVLKERMTVEILRSAAAGKDVSNLAVVASHLDPTKGVILVKGTPLWELFEERSDTDTETETAALPVEEPAPITEPEATQEDNMPNAESEQRATSYIRALAEQQDPAMRVETETPKGGGTVTQEPAPAATVNSQEPAAVVQDGEIMSEEQLRTALGAATTQEQRDGIIRLYADQIAAKVLPASAQQAPAPTVDAEAIRSMLQEAVRDAVTPIVERLDKLDEAINIPDAPPQRRSLDARPRPEPKDSDAYRPRRIQDLARSNTAGL